MNFEVLVLGANSANFAYGRHQTAQIVQHNDCLYLVDCGEATQLQLQRYKVRLSRLHHIFISHLHGDHYLGLIGLIQTMQLQGRTAPLHIFGPPGLDEIVSVQLRYSDSRLNYITEFHPLPEGPERLIYETEHLEVYTIPLTHRIACNGFRFTEKGTKRRVNGDVILKHGLLGAQVGALKRGEDITLPDGQTLTSEEATLAPRPSRTYAFCSDTIYKPDIIPLVAGADLLYHEATFTHNLLSRARETFHTTAQQAADLAAEAGVKQLLIGHYSSRYRDLNVLLDEAKQVFENTNLAEEGCTYVLEYKEAEHQPEHAEVGFFK